MRSGMRTTTERRSLGLAESGPEYPALGSELLRHLVERAREEKITRFTADPIGNRPCWP